MSCTKRLTQKNTRRMESARSGSICRRFLNGSCRLGSRCNYRHELQAIPLNQICRYFQKGGCWYGERCRYLHVLQLEPDTAVTERRSSVPTVSTSTVTSTPPDRRGSEPSLQQSEISRQECRTSAHVVNVSNPQRNTRHLASNITEERSRGADPHLFASWNLSRSSDGAQGCEGRNEQETSNETQEDGAAAAAASNAQVEAEESGAFFQSKNVTCGICMDKVYDKMEPRNQVFGILPNCNHSFCLQCIMTWRKTKDLGPDVVKSCPHCRVRSAFYVPYKYWVEGQEKECVIAAFKERFSKRSCIYFMRFGCCPFKTECLYRHDKHSRRRSLQHPSQDEDDYDGEDLLKLIIAMTFLCGNDDDDDFDFPFYLSEDNDF